MLLYLSFTRWRSKAVKHAMKIHLGKRLIWQNTHMIIVRSTCALMMTYVLCMCCYVDDDVLSHCMCSSCIALSSFGHHSFLCWQSHWLRQLPTVFQFMQGKRSPRIVFHFHWSVHAKHRGTEAALNQLEKEHIFKPAGVSIWTPSFQA